MGRQNTKVPRISKETYVKHLINRGYKVINDAQVSITTVLGTSVYDICNNANSYYLVFNRCEA